MGDDGGDKGGLGDEEQREALLRFALLAKGPRWRAITPVIDVDGGQSDRDNPFEDLLAALPREPQIRS